MVTCSPIWPSMQRFLDEVVNSNGLPESMHIGKIPYGYSPLNNLDPPYESQIPEKYDESIGGTFIPGVSGMLYVTNDPELHHEEMKGVVKNFHGRTRIKGASVYLDERRSGTELLGYEIDSIPSLEEIIGTNDIIAFNPDIYEMPKELKKSASKHEWVHHYTEGKLPITLIGARTRYGDIPLGRMLVEGTTEYLLEQNGHERPSKIIKKLTGGIPTYDTFYRLADEIESAVPGILREIHNTSDDAVKLFGEAGYMIGAMAVARILENVPEIKSIVEKYAYELNVKSKTN